MRLRPNGGRRGHGISGEKARHLGSGTSDHLLLYTIQPDLTSGHTIVALRPRYLQARSLIGSRLIIVDNDNEKICRDCPTSDARSGRRRECEDQERGGIMREGKLELR